MSELLYQKEAKNWNEALPTGNGMLGAMIFGGTRTERIQVNEDSVWSGGFRERVNPDARSHLEEVRTLLKNGEIRKAQKLAEQSMYATYPHMTHYQTLGDVWIHFANEKEKQKVIYVNDVFPMVVTEKPELENYCRKLDLDTALGSVAFQKNRQWQKREFFTSVSANVLVYRIQTEQSEKLNLQFELTRKDNRHGRGASYCDGLSGEGDDSIYLFGGQGGRKGIDFVLAAKVESFGGRQYRMGGRIVVEDAEEVILYVTARTSYRSEDPRKWCREVLSQAVLKDYEALKKEHEQEYKKWFDTCRLVLEQDEKKSELPIPERLERLRQGEEDDGLINTYYDYGRYLLISSSRPDSLPANLQGIWNEEFSPSWGSKYTININTQMNYWMAEKSGLSELHMALLKHLKKMYPHGKKVAQEMYGARGFCCHHNTDIWGDCAPQDNNMSATIWPMGGAWLCLHLIQHYEYTKDQKFIEEYFEILRDAVLFFLDYMVKDENGNWVTGPSSSPENLYQSETGEYGTLCIGPTMDLEILTELFQGYLRICESCDLQDDISGEVYQRLKGMPGLKVGKYGQIQEWQKDYDEVDPGHRHISQLFGLYPGNQIRMDQTPELAKAAKVTLERRLENGGGHTGWSKAWIILFYARLWDGENAWKHLKELLKNATLDNLFDNHPPFQIDGNFGGACGLLEMLVQDYGDEVYLLPAIPKTFPDGTLEGIRLKKGFLLSMNWKNGKIEKVQLKAQRDGQAHLILDGAAKQEINMKEHEEKVIEGMK